MKDESDSLLGGAGPPPPPPQRNFIGRMIDAAMRIISRTPAAPAPVVTPTSRSADALLAMAAALVIAGVLGHHYVYPLIDDPIQRQVWQYVLGGVTGAVLFATAGYALSRILAALDALTVAGRLLVVACFWMSLEDAQMAACGMDSYGILVTGDWSGLCRQRWGDAPYRIALYVISLALAVYYTQRGRHARSI